MPFEFLMFAKFVVAFGTRFYETYSATERNLLITGFCAGIMTCHPVLEQTLRSETEFATALTIVDILDECNRLRQQNHQNILRHLDGLDKMPETFMAALQTY